MYGSIKFNKGKTIISVSPEHMVLAQCDVANNLNDCGILNIYSNKLVFQKNTGGSAKVYDLLHTGNKPSGTYIGDGDATYQRIILTGGVGDTIIVKCSIEGSVNYTSIVTSGTSFTVKDDGTIQAHNGRTVWFTNGVFTLTTSIPALNASGVTYTYQVL